MNIVDMINAKIEADRKATFDAGPQWNLGQIIDACEAIAARMREEAEDDRRTGHD